MWSGTDLEYLQKNNPTLKLKSPTLIEGLIIFQAVRFNNQLILNPDKKLLDQCSSPNNPYICDTYTIKLEWQQNIPYPLVYETSGKIAATSKRLGKTLLDMHQFPDGALCLAPPVELVKALNKDTKIKDFIEKLLLPYLFAQSYYAKERTWIWGERSHGCLGVFESYFDHRGSGDDIELIKKYIQSLEIAGDLTRYFSLLKGKQKIKGHWLCFCASRQKFRNCHHLAFRGMWNFKEDLRRNRLSCP